MTDPEFFVPPGARVDGLSDDQIRLLNRLGVAQRWLLVALAANFTAYACANLGDEWWVLWPLAWVIAMAATARIADGLGIGPGWRVLWIFAMLFPLVSVVALLVLNHRATAQLRAHGWEVGFFGTKLR